METTEGHLLGGRLRYLQPKDGYRTGIEPVLLAAAIPAVAGQRVLEAGVGAGAGLMCLAARVPGITGVGVEIDPAMAELARHNAAANGLVGLMIRTGDIREHRDGGFDHALANPPWHPARSTPSPCSGRRLSKQGDEGALEAWTAALAGSLRPGGTLTLILPYALTVPAGAALAAAGLGRVRVVPLLPKAGRSPKLALIHAGRPGAEAAWADTGRKEKPGIVLHEPAGGYTPRIEAVLRNGGALDI